MRPELFEIENIIKLAIKYDLEFFKYGDVEFHRSNKQTSVTYQGSEIDVEHLVPPPSISTEGMPGDDEMLFYSTAAFDDMKLDREDSNT